MKSAVLVIDVQNGVFQDEPRFFLVDETLRVINQLTDQAREKHVPIIYIQHETLKGLLMYGTRWASRNDDCIKDYNSISVFPSILNRIYKKKLI